MKTIISEKFADLLYDEQTPCFIIDWNGFQKLELAKPFCEKVVSNLKETRKVNPNLTGFIGNTLNLKVISKDVETYWNEEWNMDMYNAGGRFLALIVPSNIFAQFSITKYSTEVEKNLKEVQIRFFDDIDNAKEWLKACQSNNEVE